MRFLVLLSAVLVSFSALAAEPATVPSTSLFFTKDETKKIDILAEKIKPMHARGSGIHLGAVMYYGPGEWALWLDGQRWGPDSVRPDLRVIDVQPNEVRIGLANPVSAVPQEITLRPYQTYQTATGNIVEGMR